MKIQGVNLIDQTATSNDPRSLSTNATVVNGCQEDASDQHHSSGTNVPPATSSKRSSKVEPGSNEANKDAPESRKKKSSKKDRTSSKTVKDEHGDVASMGSLSGMAPQGLNLTDQTATFNEPRKKKSSKKDQRSSEIVKDQSGGVASKGSLLGMMLQDPNTIGQTTTSNKPRTPSTYATPVNVCQKDASDQHHSSGINVPPATSSKRTKKRCSKVKPSSNEASIDAPQSKKQKTSKKFINGDLKPEERSIPDTPLLNNLGDHPSMYARTGRGTLMQNLNFRGAWPTALGLYRQAHDQYKVLFGKAGFGDFLRIDAVQLPLAYLVALTERWFSQTNTLHLASCEIGPTPLDWTMITGISFKGQQIRLDPNYPMSEALCHLGVGREAVSDGKIRLSGIMPMAQELNVEPKNDETKAVMFRRLFLYVMGSCFFSNNRSVINHELVQFVEKIDEVGCYNWGAITYAAFLAGMRRKVTGEIGAFTGFWPFLMFWAFEYLEILRPGIADEDAFPRAIRWSSPRVFSSADFSHFVAARCQLDYTDEAEVNWQPYLGSSEFDSDNLKPVRLLAQKSVPFQSVDTWEYYLGERCRRQLGFPCRVPLPPPSKMHGTDNMKSEDEIGVGRSAVDLVEEETVDYTSWFAAHSIGRIVDVSRFLGGKEIGSKVLAHWMETHHPDMMLISKSEYEAMKNEEACHASVEDG